MKSIEIKGSVRTDLGKKATRELRKNNGVPCVVYGVQKDENGNPVATHFSVTTDGLRNLVYTPHIYVVDLNIDGKTVNAIMKDIQFHPVKDSILHVDFYQIDEAKPIVMEVPVQLEGLAEGVRAGGKLALQMRKLKVKALYNAIPERLTIDVTALGLGGRYRTVMLLYSENSHEGTGCYCSTDNTCYVRSHCMHQKEVGRICLRTDLLGYTGETARPCTPGMAEYR